MKLKIIIPIAIVIILVLVVFSFQSQNSSQNVINNNTGTNCPASLNTCGLGCIPQNAACCDETNGNSYCLAPNTLCKVNPNSNSEKNRFLCSEDGNEKSNDCPTGQINCGMFCIKAGEKCCIGGICNEDKKKVTPEQLKYSGELTINANYEEDYNEDYNRYGSHTGHMSDQFSATIYFSDLIMPLGRADLEHPPAASSGRTKIVGTYTSSCSNLTRKEKDSTSGEITSGNYPEEGMVFVEMFDETVKPAKDLGLKPILRAEIPYIYRQSWCSLNVGGSVFLNIILYDVFQGAFGNTQRLANMELKKTGYMSYEGETIPFSGTIGDAVGRIVDLGMKGMNYSGTFKVYRE